MDGTAPERLTADAAGIARAAELLRAGALVAVPTETVYGLAARADSEAAVAAIFRAKGRPDFNPLIVHVASLAMARDLARFDACAEALAARYWPGPLTLVLPARPGAVVPAVTAGLPTIALRMPDHPATRRLLERGDMDDQRVEPGPALGAVDRRHRRRVVGARREAVDGLGRHRDEPPCAQQFGRARDSGRIGGKPFRSVLVAHRAAL